MQGAVTVADRPDGPGARFRFEATFEAAPDAARGAPLAGQAVAVVSPDPFVRAAAMDQIQASGGTVQADAGVVLIDHAAREPGLGLVRRPADARASFC
jgi:hypothetical protein